MAHEIIRVLFLGGPADNRLQDVTMEKPVQKHIYLVTVDTEALNSFTENPETVIQEAIKRHVYTLYFGNRTTESNNTRVAIALHHSLNLGHIVDLALQNRS